MVIIIVTRVGIMVSTGLKIILCSVHCYSCCICVVTYDAVNDHDYFEDSSLVNEKSNYERSNNAVKRAQYSLAKW